MYALWTRMIAWPEIFQAPNMEAAYRIPRF